MQPQVFNNRFGWVICGLVMGLGISFYWPHEPLKADSASGQEKFSICTVPTIVNQSDAIFVLDSVTGRLRGAAHNTQTGSFGQFFGRNVAADFGVIENGRYLMVPGFIATKGAAGGVPASGSIYVAELTSGKVGLYGFYYNNRSTETQELRAIDSFSFREGN